ncbi:MAG: carboxypeptidase-like regulatory domain-containing protein [Prolixibacteraceae bacterium]
MQRLFTILALFIVFFSSAQKSTLSGIITDEETGETLVNAAVVLEGNDWKGTVTNENGVFSLPGINPQLTEVVFSFLGYESITREIDFKNQTNLFVEIALHPADILLGEITIVDRQHDRLGDSEIEISQHTLTPKTIQSIPTARNDVFKALRYLPGIEPTEPLSPLVSVRGSDPGENLIMLDGVTIYNPYHFMSSSGIFNMQTVKNVDMLVGGFGAEYGGRNSSVINIATKDGNNSSLHGEVRPSTSESKLFLEFPVGAKTTMMVAGRFNYDLAGNFMLYSTNYFYDANLSLTHRFNAKNSLTLKYFSSSDRTNLDFNSLYRYMGNSIGMSEIFDNMSLKWINRWNNNIATAIYKSVLTSKLFLRAQVYASLHGADNFSEMSMLIENEGFDTQTTFKSKVHDWSAKMNLEYKPFFWNEVKLGAEYNQYLFYNASMLNKIDNGSAERSPKLISFFAEDKITWGSLLLRPGLRFAQFENGKFLAEPRLNAVFKVSNSLKLQAAWGRYNQYVVSMNTQEFEFNQFLDYYYPLSNGKPSQSEHFIVGAEKVLPKNHTLSVDLYYKNISRTYIFDLLQDRYEAFAMSNKIVAGSGKSYGMELMWQGSFGQFSGWSSYTLSKSTRSFPNIMNGKEYDYDYDRRHSFKTVMNYQATKRIAYSASFIAQSGIPKSIENTLQNYYMYDPLTGSMFYSPQFTVNEKNASRLPWLLYLDFGLQKKIVSGFGKDLSRFFGADESYLVLTVYNALFFRRNVLYYLTASDDGRYIPMGDNYFPTVSAGYTIKF